MSEPAPVRFSAGGLEWLGLPSAVAGVRDVVAAQLDDLEALPGAVLVKRNLVRAVIRADVPGLGDVIVKRYAVRGPLDWAKYAVRASRAEAEWETSRALRSAGIPTVACLAMGELRSIVLRDAALVVRTIPGARFLNQYVRESWGDARDEHRSELFLSLSRTVRRMHDAGFVHNDLHGGNVLVNGPPDAPALHVIDLHSVARSSSPGETARWSDIVTLLHAIRLDTTTEERVAMCRAYEEEGGRPSGTRVGALLSSGGLTAELEPRLAALEKRRVKSRTARALGRSSRFDVTRLSPYRVHHLRAIRASAFLPLIKEHAATLAVGGRAVLKDSHRSALTRQTLRIDDERRSVIVKEYRIRGVAARLKNQIRTTRDVAAWTAGYGLIVRGFEAAEPLALLCLGRGLLLSSSFLVMEDLGDSTRLDLVALERFAGALDSSGRGDKRRLIAATAHLLRRLHATGTYHADLKAVNLFLRESGERTAVVLADYDRVEFDADVPRRRRLKNLSQLSASIPICISHADRLRFFRAYARDEPELLADWKACFRHVAELCRQKIVVRMEPIE